MYYPWWYIPGLTAPMLIAIVAVVHVFVSHYAVGGGILIALENRFAVANGDQPYRDYWYKHAKFFVLLTVAFGAITGVGIWWTIALASPLATETLIRTFVFGWAIEWVFFVIEIVSAFIMYYFWYKLKPKTHVIIAAIYAIAAWISLVLITGITAFMLDSRGLFANWSETGNFWHAFFNVQFLPQTIARTGGAVLLAALYVFVHATWTLGNDSFLLEKVVKRMSRPIIFGIITMALGIAMSFILLPEHVQRAMERAVLLNVLVVLFFGICSIMVLLMFFGPVLYPKSVSHGFAVCLLVFGFAALSTAEFIREAARKPWIVDQVVLGSQVYKDKVDEFRATGFLRNSQWQKIPSNKIERGGMIFMYHCNNCHALESGLSAIVPLLSGEDDKTIIKNKLRQLNKPVISMPPWSGTEAELDDLSEFLRTISREKYTKTNTGDKLPPKPNAP
ncbi:MAG: cytochrome ubiquinol oxidase subunit I [Planctomycetaceae bacterium]|jgi:cytochrome bd-type quinol oxidase subunit 1|nr:cytochrome ubiquinol oxidase subunit I [Planctomycetaceae bacterium]